MVKNRVIIYVNSVGISFLGVKKDFIYSPPEGWTGKKLKHWKKKSSKKIEEAKKQLLSF
jgi:hypothetical protein